MTKKIHIALAQVNPCVGDLEKNARLIRQTLEETPNNTDLVIFPEMVLSGYPLEDLVLKPSFLDDASSTGHRLIKETEHLKPAFILALPWQDDGRIYNTLHLVHKGKILATRYKNQLPNEGVFDEFRTFSPGPLPDPVPFMGHQLGLMICRDMWSKKPAGHLAKMGADMLIVINGSPYETGKTQLRRSLAAQRVRETTLPLVYVNAYGGQDELVFDGGSFIMNEKATVIFQAPYFEEYFQRTVWEKKDKDSTWLYAAEPVTPVPEEEELMYSACVLGLRDYLHKNGRTDVLIGLSGGIDSALSAAIAVDALGSDHVHAVMMPSPYTSEKSLSAAKECASMLQIDYKTIPITDLMTQVTASLPGLKGLAYENMQSRLRGLLLMSLSNMHGQLVLSTGNKSENAMGYATLYGDMCGAFNVLKDMVKTRVYALSTWRNAHKPGIGLGNDGPVIPKSIITRLPTAELRPDQLDQDTLPPYEILDEVISLLVEEDLSIEDIAERGFDADLVADVWDKIDSQEYKRRQASPGVKLTRRCFGRERRYPMTNNYRPAGHRTILAKNSENS